MTESAPKPIDPSALSITDAARLLSKAGGRIVSEAALQSDIDAGAPTNPDGTINLVTFTAWHIQEMANRGD